MNEHPKTLRLGYGVSLPSIADQLTQQGFNFSNKKVDEFEKARQALLTLRFGEFDCPDGLYNKLTQRLHDKITAHIKLQNKQPLK